MLTVFKGTNLFFCYSSLNDGSDFAPSLMSLATDVSVCLNNETMSLTSLEYQGPDRSLVRCIVGIKSNAVQDHAGGLSPRLHLKI